MIAQELSTEQQSLLQQTLSLVEVELAEAIRSKDYGSVTVNLQAGLPILIDRRRSVKVVRAVQRGLVTSREIRGE